MDALLDLGIEVHAGEILQLLGVLVLPRASLLVKGIFVGIGVDAVNVVKGKRVEVVFDTMTDEN